MVLLSVVEPPSGAGDLAKLVGIVRDGDGWFTGWTTTSTDEHGRGGIFVAGVCQGRRTSPSPRPRPWRLGCSRASSAGGAGQQGSVARAGVEGGQPPWPVGRGEGQEGRVDESITHLIGARAVRCTGREQVLPLRELQRRLPLLRGAFPLSAKVDALPADGPGRQAQGRSRALALLLLRRVLRRVPARGRAGRDHDEHAPVAHLPLRLHRYLAAHLQVVASRARRHPPRRRPDRCRLLPVRLDAR
jgi:hypothetical protein